MYSLKALAEKEDVNYSYLRRVVPSLEEPRVWRGYSLFRLGEKNAQWVAVKSADPIEFFQ